jgi:hypothetical protein
MKTLKEVVEVPGEGLESLLGERVTLFCSAYIYTGTLIGVNNTCVKLTKAAIVYETGPLNTKTFADVQALPHDWYVQISSIESFGVLKE